MNISDKEQKIKEKIREIIGINIDIDQKAYYDSTKHFRIYKIKKILLVSSSVNYSQLENEVKPSNLFSEMFSLNEFGDAPEIIHVETANQCFSKLKNEHFDLILFFNEIEGINETNLFKKIREITNLPIVILANDLNYLDLILSKNKNFIFKAFKWNDKFK